MTITSYCDLNQYHTCEIRHLAHSRQVLQEEAGGVAIQDYRDHCQASPHGQLLTHHKTGALTHQNLGFRRAPKISQI